MIKVLTSGFTSFLVCLAIVPLIIVVAKKTNFFEIPGGRRIHKSKTPSMGGIAIFIGFTVGVFACFGSGNLAEFRYFFLGCFIIFLTGVRDDLSDLSARLKMLGQFLAAFILVHFGGYKLTSLHGLFGIEQVPIFFQYSISILTIIVITNAFNLIDGIDGLAGSIAVLSTLTFGLWFYFAQTHELVIISTALIGAVAGFLVFNISPAKIFMGDSGSLFLGFVLSFLCIYFIEKAEVISAFSVIEVVPVAVAVLLYPLFDLLRVFILRISRGQSPFHGDKIHVHHILLRTGLNHNQTTLSIFSYTLLVIVLVLKFNRYGILGSFLIIIGLCIVALVLLSYRIKKFARRNRKPNL